MPLPFPGIECGTDFHSLRRKRYRARFPPFPPPFTVFQAQHAPFFFFPPFLPSCWILARHFRKPGRPFLSPSIGPSCLVSPLLSPLFLPHGSPCLWQFSSPFLSLTGPLPFLFPFPPLSSPLRRGAWKYWCQPPLLFPSLPFAWILFFFFPPFRQMARLSSSISGDRSVFFSLPPFSLSRTTAARLLPPSLLRR